MKRLGSIAIVVMAALAGACSSGSPGRPPATVTFQLHNEGASTVYLFESCEIDFTITSLADPVHAIAREAACACECGQAQCPLCGACFEGARDVAIGAMLTATWNTVDVTTVATPTGSCERRSSLPDGPYRIDVPVYASAADAAAGTSGYTASQSFSLPAPGDVVDVALGASP